MRPTVQDHRLGRFVFALIVAGLLFSQAREGLAAVPQSKLANGLQDLLAQSRPDEDLRVLVMLYDRVDTRALAALSPYRQERHEMIMTALREKADKTQAGLLQFLGQEKARGLVTGYRNYWITNLVAVQARPEVILAIAARPEVETIYIDYPVELIEPVGSSPATSPGAAEPGLRDINANKLWDIGITGSSVIVMNLDTGVDGAHPALASRWRGLVPGVDPHWAWFNIDNPTQTFPTDYGFHGTHTMGTLTGLAPATHDTIGVAIGATWIAAAWDYTTLPKFISDVIAEFNWGADPDGNPQTVDDVPAVISNSWGVGVLFGQPPCDASFWSAIDNAEAAGAAVVFAAGNEGPGAMTLRAPADRNTTPTNCFSVGALNPGSATIASFSSRGPTACAGTTEEKIKPEVCARGVQVRSAYPGGSYINLDGTSMACPHVAGALALLRDAFPDATVDELKTALMETAVDLGTTGEDNTYGHGRIDVWAAYNSLLGGGTLCGDITSFQARCVGASSFSLQFRINLLNSTIHAGETVTFDVDGTQYIATVFTNGIHSRAQVIVAGATAGSHTISLVDPAGCVDPIVVTCGASAGAEAEWEQADALWNGTEAELNTAPQATKLLGNYPNPFNPSTTISYVLAEETSVSVKVYNMIGQEVATLVNGVQKAGEQSVIWHGANDLGQPVASGLYLYRLRAGSVVQTEKMLFMK